MPFGTTVSAYSGKPSSSLTKYKDRVPTAQIQSYNPTGIQVQSTPKPASFQPNASAGGSNMSAASGRGSNIPTMQAQVANPIFQPMMSGNIFNDRSDPAYSRLGKINETTDILNEGSQQKLSLANSIIRRRNAQRQSQATYDSGYQAAGGGDSFYNGDPGDSGLSPEQLAYARQIADIGRRRGLNDNAIQIAMMTSLAESEMKNINFGDRDSLGLFQQRPSQGWGSREQVTNPEYAINKFYESLQKTNWQSMSPWQAAQAVQRSFDPTGSNYRNRYATAQAAFRAINGPSVGSAINPKYSGTAGNFINSFNNKYIDYDGAYGNQCVDLYNYYTARVAQGRNIMVGWAPEIYNSYDTKAYARTGANVPGAMGYVAIFRPGGSTPSGHVAIVVGDNGNGTLRVLHSNATAAGSRGNTTISNISKSSLMGYLIPRKLMR
jgi:CHAP domain-containing protein